MSMYCKSFSKRLFGFKMGVFKFAHIFFKVAFKATSVPVNMYFQTGLFFPRFLNRSFKNNALHSFKTKIRLNVLRTLYMEKS